MLRLQWSTLVFQLLNFFILLAVLGRFLYRPLLEAMRRREQAIADRVRDAEERAERADADRAKLADASRLARAEAEALLANARAEASRLREEQRAGAQQEAARLLDDARRRIADEERLGGRRLADAARGSAVKIAASLIGKVAGRPFHEALVAQLLDSGLGLGPAQVDLLRRALGHAGGEVVVEAAYPIAAEARQRIEETLAKILSPGGDPARVTFRAEPALGAGLRIVVGVGVVDLSLRHTLADLEREATTLEP